MDPVWLQAGFWLLVAGRRVVYGSLEAVIILLLWFYLTGVTILIGGEVNALIEQAAARAGDPEAKAAGEKLPDESARVRAAGMQSK